MAVTPYFVRVEAKAPSKVQPESIILQTASKLKLLSAQLKAVLSVYPLHKLNFTIKMKKYIYSIPLLIALLIFGNSCKEYDQEQQQLWDKVMVVHDEVMPKMGELHQLKKQLKKQEQNPTQQEAIQVIEAAQDAMMDWMRNYKSMSVLSKLGHAEAIAYLQKEQERVAKVKKMMLESIDKGNALIEASKS